MANNELAALQPYCENDMRLLKRMAHSIFRGLNTPIANADYADFYSIANETLWKAYNAYNPDMGVSFDGFLRSCLQKKFKSELTYQHRDKRIANQLAVSLDAANKEGEECSLLEFVPSDFDTFEEAVKEQQNGQYSDKVRQYLSKLSNRQINILNLMIDGYRSYEIRKILDISEKEYSDDIQLMRSYEKARILF